MQIVIMVVRIIRVKVRKDLPELFCEKRYTNFANFARKTPVLQSLFNKVVGLELY